MLHLKRKQINKRQRRYLTRYESNAFETRKYEFKIMVILRSGEENTPVPDYLAELRRGMRDADDSQSPHLGVQRNYSVWISPAAFKKIKPK